MPGYILHMLHGEMFLNQYGPKLSDEEKKQFRIGLVMPDSKKERKDPYDKSHFYNSEQKDKIIKSPDLNKFISRYQINNPFVLGYAAHLYLDKLFFENYFKSCVLFLDKDGLQTNLVNNVVSVNLLKSNEIISFDRFYSNDYLYGDYTMTNNYIIKKYNLKAIEETQVNNPITEINIKDLSYVQLAINNYIKPSSENLEMKVFSIESLENAIDKYAFGFAQWTDGIRSILKI